MERQAEGIVAAKRRQTADAARQEAHRPPRAVGPAELSTLRRLVDAGVSGTEAARPLKIGQSTAHQALAGTAE